MIFVDITMLSLHHHFLENFMFNNILYMKSCNLFGNNENCVLHKISCFLIFQPKTDSIVELEIHIVLKVQLKVVNTLHY